MDYVVNGIVLKVQSYKDKDVLINLFTAELGKITAVLKGVRGANAKLKYASQLFCFGEWQLAEKGGKYTVTSCSAENSFFELTADYDKYSLGCAMLQMCDIVLKPNIISAELLVCLLKSLKTLTYDDYSERLVFLKFALSFASIVGYGFNWGVCGNCGSKLIGQIDYSIANKTFTCVSCAGFGATNVSNVVYTNLKIIDQTSLEKLNTISIKPNVINDCLFFVKLHIENVLGVKLSTLDLWA